jgi:hypothetical protein
LLISRYMDAGFSDMVTTEGEADVADKPFEPA